MLFLKAPLKSVVSSELFVKENVNSVLFNCDPTEDYPIALLIKNKLNIVVGLPEREN